MKVLDKVQSPNAGCVVEFIHGNLPTLAIVLEEQSGRLRLYTQNRREMKLPSNRLLPWFGPQYSSSLSREEMLSCIERHQKKREELLATINTQEVWRLTEGEVEKGSAAWFANLFFDTLTVDHEAAMGHALLLSKTHFRFSPPDFEIYDQATVEKKIADAECEKTRDMITRAGIPFFQTLWANFMAKGKPAQDLPKLDDSTATYLASLLLNRIAEPDSQEDDLLWKQLIKGLPSDPFLPLFLAQSWKIIPPHYNYLLDRIGYSRGDTWSEEFDNDKKQLLSRLNDKKTHLLSSGPLAEGIAEGSNHEALSFPFISIDPASTKDRDDAFYVEQCPDGNYRVAVAIACPAICWDFGSKLDKAVQRRAASLYLPEGDEHMLPADIGWKVFGLDQSEHRVAMVLDMVIDTSGACLSFRPLVGMIKTAINLTLNESENFFLQAASSCHGNECSSKEVTSRHESALFVAMSLAGILKQARIDAGAVIIEKPDSEVILVQENEQTIVSIDDSFDAPLTHSVVGEIMIFANSNLASWAATREIPLFYRTQDVGLPKEFSGVWKAPQDIARVVRSLPPATLETQPKRHAGLGVAAYINATSPIRRYVDILNQAQIIHWLEDSSTMLSKDALTSLFPLIQASMESTSQVQRFRPRYWKLVFFQQKGDKIWWKGIVADENDAFVTIALPFAQFLVRGKRKLFDEKVFPGQEVELRVGKINPLQNEITVLEAREY